MRLSKELAAENHDYPVRRLLTNIDVIDDGYSDDVAAEGEDTGADVRAHRRVFERLGFFAETDEGVVWGFDVASNLAEPPIVGLDTEGQYAWLGIDLDQVLTQDEEAGPVATQFLPSLEKLRLRYDREEKGAPAPPAWMSQRPSSADDPVSWLARLGSEVSAALLGRLPAHEPIAECDEEGHVSTIWLPRQGPVAHLSVRGVALGDDKKTLKERLGVPTKEGAKWVRFDDGMITLHFELDGSSISRITLMTTSSAP